MSGLKNLSAYRELIFLIKSISSFIILQSMKLLKLFLKSELNLDPDLYMNKFIQYEKLLLEKNKTVNLVSRKSKTIEDHILNSVFFLKNFKLRKGCLILDLGTGGGFPGIPLKILFPESYITMIDSIKKKTNALNEIVNGLNLNNAEILCGRAEELSESDFYKNKFDYVISKAVAPLKNLFEWGKNFLNPEGEILCIKGGDLCSELSELKKLRKPPSVEIINYDFDAMYKIEDKKLAVLRNNF